MKKLLNHFIILFAFCYFATPAAAQNFEGVIHYDVPNMENSGITKMFYQIKGEKTRLDFNSGPNSGSMLYLPEESKMVILIEQQKGYISIDTDSDQENNEEFSEVEAAKTGDTKSIAGKECQVWKIESQESTVETCMAKGMGTFMMPKNPMGRDNTPRWAKELMAEGAMPLEVIEIKNGSRSTQMRATKIEEKSLSADLFVIPKGYQDMSAMLRQMQQMRSNGN